MNKDTFDVKVGLAEMLKGGVMMLLKLFMKILREI